MDKVEGNDDIKHRNFINSFKENYLAERNANEAVFAFLTNKINTRNAHNPCNPPEYQNNKNNDIATS